jgi:hypothetical protein
VKTVEERMQVGPSIQGEAFRYPLIKLTSNSRLGSMCTVFVVSWINDVAFGPGEWLASHDVAERLATVPKCAPFSFVCSFSHKFIKTCGTH